MRSTLQILAGGALAALLLAAAPGCAQRNPAPATGDAAPTQLGAAVTPAAAQAFLAEHPEALLLDVRNPGEWDDDLGHIDSARLVPLPELPSRLGELQAWKDKPVITVCRVGARSAAAATLLRSAGFSEVANLEGGMVAWRRAGR